LRRIPTRADHASYLKHQRGSAREALARLTSRRRRTPDAKQETHDADEAAIERRFSLNEQRHAAVMSVLRSAGRRAS